jgi:uncharacterized protein YunC (DUF1805 family)
LDSKLTARVILLDSITAISASALDAVIVSGSHGGRSSTGFAIDNPERPRIVFFNDAGIGKDNAGIYCLQALQSKNLACACYAHTSARIGEAQDGYSHGLVSSVNIFATALGIEVGMLVREACEIAINAKITPSFTKLQI